MKGNIIDKYAEIVIKRGINLKKGQCLKINTSINTYDFALKIAEKGYKAGAKYISIEVDSRELKKIRYENVSLEDLEYIPNYLIEKANEWAKDEWGLINIANLEELDVLKDVDPQKIQKETKVFGEALKDFHYEMKSNKLPWCVVAYPGPKWASKIMGTDSVEKAIEMLWDKLIPIMRLDKEDPLKAWENHVDTLKSRVEKLTTLDLDKIKFIGEGTDLEIGFVKKFKWIGGSIVTKSGQRYIPNLPTEEVFTTPDRYRTNGTVKVTRPLQVMGRTVKGVTFTFRDGKVIDFDAEEGKEILESYLKVDDGASYLGEVAIVDLDSPINRADMQFDCILYDENATCHIALGSGFPEAMPELKGVKDPKEKIKFGCNDSFVHTDFMIGSDKLDIVGYKKDGEEIKIMEKGKILL